MREQKDEGEAVGAREGDEPAHHARRPMNAFLIFCKRHRAVVRDKYPNLENRSITKILGEWWANLEDEEKACYTGLAKQYKDAFFCANPDFKWYKLPAPPLRTLAPRPAATSAAPASPASPAAPSPEPITTNNSTKYDYNRRLVYDEAPLSMFTPGKLADEAHMGGLSSLITSNQTDNNGLKPEQYSYKSSLSYTTSSPVPARTEYENNLGYSCHRSQGSERTKSRSREDDIRELQNALSETTRVFEDFDEKPVSSFENNNRDMQDNNFTNQEIINEIVDRRIMKEDFLNDDPNQIDYRDDKTARSGRSCKGKRYQEFMAVGGLLVNKRPRRDDTPEGYNASCSWDYSGHADESNEDGRYHKTEYEMSSESDKQEPQETETNESKAFKPADFDLDAKIQALPSLSLEKFQDKKRESKKKKKSAAAKPKSTRQQYSDSCYTDTPRSFGVAPSWRAAVIGSQKRKPRKISITRLEVNSMVERTAEKSSPEMKLATEAPLGLELAAHAHDADLLALATLAEVAASTSRIDPYPAPM